MGVVKNAREHLDEARKIYDDLGAGYMLSAIKVQLEEMEK